MRKVVLVYDIEEIIELEKKLDEIVERKKEAIRHHNYDFYNEQVKKIDEEAEHLEH